jgi:peroxiredoxin Q/BCP
MKRIDKGALAPARGAKAVSTKRTPAKGQKGKKALPKQVAERAVRQKAAKKASVKKGAAAPAKTQPKKGARASAKSGASARADKASAMPAKTASAAPKKAVPAKKTAAPKKASRSPETGSGLVVGDTVPEFELPDQDGAMVSSASLAGKPYVLYFYPKDDTPGCTKEACGFRDEIGKFHEAGVRILGVSPDKPESHARFRDKYGLDFTLLSDADKTLATACGVWVKKQNYGREYMGIERSTFLVDESGKVKQVWRNVRVDGHVRAVLEATI